MDVIMINEQTQPKVLTLCPWSSYHVQLYVVQDSKEEEEEEEEKEKYRPHYSKSFRIVDAEWIQCTW